MENNVVITLSARHDTEQETEDMELTAGGSMVKMRDKLYIAFAHTGPDGEGESRTTLKVDGGTVTMLRHGAFQTQMVFEKDRQYTGYYHTPFGAITLCVTTQQLEIDVGEEGGRLFIDYLLEMNRMPAVHNQIDLTIRKVGIPNDHS